MAGGVRPSYDELAALVAAQAAEIKQLRAEVAELKRRLGQNSRNSSRPPSSDGYAKPVPKSLRRKTGRPKGKQPGSPGASLEMTADPDHVVDHVPSACQGCGSRLGGAVPVGVVRRQVHDVPPVRPVVTEHRMHRRRCGCGAVTTAPAPQGVTAPACYGPRVTALAAYLLCYQHIPVERTARLLTDLAGIPVSTGWVAGVLPRTAEGLEAFAARVKAAVAAAPVTHFDETGVRVAGATWWLHSASTTNLTSYFLHQRRGKSAMDDFGVLPGYGGIAVHDGWTAYRHYDAVTHARCNAHHLRELAAAAETHPQQRWPQQLSHVLEELNTAAHTARQNGHDAIPPAVLAPLIDRWDKALRAGTTKHPPDLARNPGRTAQSRTRNLLERLARYRHEVLRFAFDLTVPFTNNQAERDLRMTKAQLKITGGWRTRTGAEHWLTVRSYISTTRKNGLDTLTTLHNAITGNPWLPSTPATT